MAFAVMKRRKLITALNLLGISFTLAFITVIYALYDLQFGPVYPLIDSNKIVFYHGLTAKLSYEQNEFPISLCNDYETYKRLQRELESVEHFSFYRKSEFGFFHDGKYMTLSNTYTDAGYWDMMDFKIIEGRLFSHDDVENRNNVAVISSYTASILYPEGNAIGNNIKIEKNSFIVIGIVEDVGMKSLSFADVWVPITSIQGFQNKFTGDIIFYLHDKARPENVSIEISNWYKKNKEEILAQIGSTGPYKVIPPDDEINLISFGESGYLETIITLISPDVRNIPSSNIINSYDDRELLKINVLLVVIIILFLLIPVINMVNLNSSQIGDRASEIGIRKSFGATVKVLVRQFLVENTILTLVGGILSLGISLIAMGLLKDHLLNTNPLRDVVGAFHLNWRIITMCFFTAVVFGLISGVLPAYRMSKLNAVNAIKGTTK